MFIKVALDDFSEAHRLHPDALGAASCWPWPARERSPRCAGAGRGGRDRLRAGRHPVPADHLRREPHRVPAGRHPRLGRADLHRAARDRLRPRRALAGWGRSASLSACSGWSCSSGSTCRAAATRSLGGLMVLAASLCYAVGAMLFKHKLPGAPPVGVAAARGRRGDRHAAAVPCQPARSPPSFKAAGSLVLLGTAGTGIAFLWFYTLISEMAGARIGHRLHRPGLQRRLRRRPARRGLQPGGHRRARAHPGRLVAGGRGPRPRRPARPALPRACRRRARPCSRLRPSRSPLAWNS